MPTNYEMKWRPIASAQKDGSTYILLLCKNPTPKHICVGVWFYSFWKAIHSEVKLIPIAWMLLPSKDF